MTIQRIVPTNKYICDGLIWDIVPEDFGIHKLNYVVIRATKDSRNVRAKTIIVLPDCFNGNLNKGRCAITVAKGFDQRSVDIFNEEVVPNKKQSISMQVDTNHHTERHTIYLFQNNNLLEDLKLFCREKFPHSDVYIQGFQTVIENNGIICGEGDTLTITWARKRIVRKGGIYGIRMTKINEIDIQDNIEYFSNSELKNAAGIFRHGGLMEETCKIGEKDNGIYCTID